MAESGAGRVAVTAREVAVMYAVSLRTVERWVRLGCPVLRLPGRGSEGRALRFLPADVTRWLTDQTPPADTPRRGRPRRAVGGGAA